MTNLPTNFLDQQTYIYRRQHPSTVRDTWVKCGAVHQQRSSPGQNVTPSQHQNSALFAMTGSHSSSEKMVLAHFSSPSPTSSPTQRLNLHKILPTPQVLIIPIRLSLWSLLLLQLATTLPPPVTNPWTLTPMPGPLAKISSKQVTLLQHHTQQAHYRSGQPIGQ
jgi:hypothetical protein